MKKIIIAACALLALCSCASNNACTIKGDVKGAEGLAKLYVGKNVVDSATVTDGKFTFKETLTNPEIYRINIENQGNPIWAAMVFGENGTITATGVANSYDSTKVSGTPSNDASNAFNEKSAALMEEYGKETTTDAQRDSLEKVYNAAQAEAMKANKGNLFGLFLLSQSSYEMEPQALLDTLATFQPELQASQTAVKMKEHAEKQLNVAIGKKFIEISLPDSTGKNNIKLSEVIAKNKYTLLDFFASWCGPCMGEAPALVAAYKDYHKKGFEIYGVSLDKEAANWKKCLVEKNFTWPNVSDLLYWDCAPAKDYAVNAIPSNFLIDAEGTIVATNLRGEDLAKKLAELLK
jgi:peroxiredoxin